MYTIILTHSMILAIIVVLFKFGVSAMFLGIFGFVIIGGRTLKDISMTRLMAFFTIMAFILLEIWDPIVTFVIA